MGSQCPTILSGGTVKVLVLVIGVMKYQVLIGPSWYTGSEFLFRHVSLSCRVKRLIIHSGENE